MRGNGYVRPRRRRDNDTKCISDEDKATTLIDQYEQVWVSVEDQIQAHLDCSEEVIPKCSPIEMLRHPYFTQ